MTRGSTAPLPFRIVAACLVLMLALPPAAVSNPQGAAVRHGQVRIEGGAGQLQIRQMSQRAVIDWESFSIDRGELTHFIQPGASSAVLNRVRGNAASQIEGMLRANGRVYLINPNGILIGPNGSIDVAGFVASTLDPGDRAFLRGGSMRFSGNSDAAVINLGSISALDGDVVLMGGSVLNAGELRAPNGTAALAAGNDILLAESGQERVFVRGAAGAKKSEGVTNTGTIEANIAELKAHGGNVYGIAVKNEGRIAATGVTRNGGRILLSAGGGAVRSTGTLEAKRSGGAGGRIKVDSGNGGRTTIGGTVDASGTSAAGGEIAILGNEIEVFDGALILNDGATSGGTTRIGGGLQGGDARFRNAEFVTVAEGARISAEATRAGTGGQVIVFSRGSLTFGGSLSVRGADGGGGGFAELSGQREVHVRDLGRQVDLGASAGPAGTLLIDPSDIFVNVGPNSGLVSGTLLTDGSLSFFLENIGSLAITTSGTGGNGDITFAPDTNVSWTSANSLSFLADRDLVLTAGAKILGSGFGNFSATAGRSILLSPGSEIRTTHGDLALSANQGPVPTQGNFSGISVDGATVQSLGLGALTVSGRGGDLGSWNSGVSVTGGGRISGGNGGVARIIGSGGLSIGASNLGVQVSGAGSVITTIGSALEVTGTGGGSGAASSGNAGVFVSSLGAISSGAGGNVTIEGTGGQGGGNNQKGVWISQAGMDAGSITTGGGTLSITGTGGGVGTASNNQGIDLAGSNTLLSAVGGSLELFATAGSNTPGGGLRLSGLLNTTGNHPISLNADGIEILSGASVTSGTATTSLRPLTAGFAIALGGTDTATSLGLTDGELDRVSAGLLQIGDSDTGTISVIGALSPVSPLSITGGKKIDISAGIFMGPGHGLTVTATDPDDGDIFVSGASAVLSASGNGSILLDAARGIRIENGGISAVNGGLSLFANRRETPATGTFTGIDLDNASLHTTGSGSILLSGRGGDAGASSHGILLRGGSTLFTGGQGLSLSGNASDPTASAIRIELASLGAGGSLIDLTGGGGILSIHSSDAAAMIGTGSDSLLLKSFSGDVEILGKVGGSSLQLLDFSETGSVDFSLTNGANHIDRINASGYGEDGRVGSVDFRNSFGFRVTEFLDVSGIHASGSVNLRGGPAGTSPLVIDRAVRSWGGNLLVEGGDVRVESAAVTTTGSGTVTLTAERSLLVTGNSLLSVEDGNLVLEANRGEAPVSGPFTGIVVLGSRLESLGSGSIRLSGTGGTGAAGGFGGGPGSPGDGGGGSGYPYPGGPPPPTVGIHLGDGTGIHSADESPGNLAIELYGTGGGGMSDSVGILLTGSTTTLSTAGRGILVQGTGGGGANGQRNRGILFSGGLIEAADQGNITLLGNGGNGVNENDGIQMDGGATIRVAGGGLGLEGYAGETLGIGVMLGIQAGDLAVDGTGSLTIRGDGSNAHGVVLGNAGASLGGPLADRVDIESGIGGVMLHRTARASGNLMITAAAGNVFSDGDVVSTSGDIRIEGDDVTLSGPVTANVGDVLIHFGDDSSGSGGDPSPPLEGPTAFDGMAEINQLPVAGGRVRFFGGIGGGDVLTFSGADADGVDLDFADLDAIEEVIGSAASGDRLSGPEVSSTYHVGGGNAFNVGGIAFSGFENLVGGGHDDVFAFTGDGSIDGSIDGGGGINRLDYSASATGIAVNLATGSATGIGEGFANIARFTGSDGIDTFTGPDSASIYEFTTIDALKVGTAWASGFENVVAGPMEDRFVFRPGSGLRGFLDGGTSAIPVNNLLDYSEFGSAIFINLGFATALNLPGGFSRIDSFLGSASGRDLFIGPNTPTTYVFSGLNRFFATGFQAAGFENLSGGAAADTFLPGPGSGLAGGLSGGPGPEADTLSYALFGRPVSVAIGPNTSPGIGGRFFEIETIVGSPGNDRFQFLDQVTIGSVDGGGGTDLIEINDSTLRGDHTYDITANSVSRNPLYTFNNFEALRLFLGPGNNTVNSGFFPQTQFLHAGNGFNTLNLPGVTTLDGANPVGNVYHYGFASPRPGSNDTGGLLRIARSQAAPDANEGPDRGSDTPVAVVDPATLNAQIAALGGAFSAAVVAQAVIATVDGNSYLVLRPFSLDGSGLSPSNLGLAALRENLGVAANLELAAAIGFDGPVFLFNPDGPYSIDLSEVPADPAILTVLQESLSIAAASELAAALGLPLTASITGTDGILPTGLDGSVPGPNVLLIFGEQLGAPAEAELNAAIAAGN